MKNKLFIIILTIVVLSMLPLGATAATKWLGYALRTDAFAWEKLGSTTTAYTTPAVNERDYANLVANHADAVVHTFQTLSYNGIQFRFVTDDDGDDTVFDLFASKGQDYFTRIATLTIKGGTQVGPATTTDASAVFCDTITVTNEQWGTTMTVIDGDGADRIASIVFDTMGFDTFAFVGTTVDDTTDVYVTGY